MTSSDRFDTHSIIEYKGLVNGEVILTTNALKDWFNKTQKAGGRAKGYESELRKARNLAIADMEQEAMSLGANAVIAIDIDYQALGEHNNIMMVCATGTAVVVQ
jgi:uncharacterized protein YbjQ (UPF0145 family)